MKWNLNNEIIIYPNERGWVKIKELVTKKYGFAFEVFDVDLFLGNKKTSDGGYKDQMWCIISDFGEMYFNGQQYFENAFIELPSPDAAPQPDKEAILRLTPRWSTNEDGENLYREQQVLEAMDEYAASQGKDVACPCLYLDEPCHEKCTCRNGWSSLGCMYCATYGSLEQRKAAAKRIAAKLSNDVQNVQVSDTRDGDSSK